MAGTVDGSITIRTDIDTKGFKIGRQQIENGISGIKSSLGKLAAAVGIAFGTAAVINFGKEAVKSASELNDAMKGLQSIAEGQGRSFEKAQGFINDYIKDGLVPMTNAVTAYKNLAARGYSDEQIQKTMTALKDAAAYGRQTSYSLGDAVTSATEGLKNENSILVDNAGVTKNVSKMWEDYARSIGTTRDKLTQEQKIQAEVNGILQETRFQTGDAAKVAKSYSGQVSQLSFNFNNLKVAIGNAIIPILQSVLPYVNAAISALTSFFNTVGQLMSELFGVEYNQMQSDQLDGVSDSANKAAVAQDNLAASTKKAGKAAKDNLQSFDKLNVRQKDTSTADSATGSASSDTNITHIKPTVNKTNAKNAGSLAEIGKYLNPLKAIDLSPLTNSLKRLKDALKPLTKSMFSGLDWAYHNLFVPLAEFTIEEVLPRFLDILSEAVDGLTTILDCAKSVWQTFYEKCLKPIAEFAGKKMLDFLDGFKDKLSRLVDKIQNSTVFEDLCTIFEKLGPVIADVVNGLINIESLKVNIIWSAIFAEVGYIFDQLADSIGLVADLLSGDLSEALDHLANLVIWNKVKALDEFFKGVKDAVFGFLGLNDQCIESIDIFGEEISDNTKNKVNPFIKEVQKFDDTLAKIDYGNLKIDDSIVKNVKDQTKSIADTIVNELSADKNESLKNLAPLKKSLGEEAYNDLVKSTESYYTELTNKTTYGETEINKIVSNASKEKRALTDEEKSVIQRIRDEMNSNGIEALSDTEVEYQTIMNRLKDNSVAISVEQASDIIKNAKETKEKTIEDAEEQYTRQVMEAQRLYEAGAINEDQYKSMIEAATKTKKETIENANKQYDTIVTNTKKKLGENSKNINYETGEVKNKWQKFCDDTKEKWGGLWDKVSKKWDDFKTDFKKGWNGFWNSIGNFFIDIWNGIVGALEWAINGIVGLLNKIKIDVPDWFPGLGGKTFGFNLPTVKFDRVPRLATGAVIPPNSEFLAVLGDQRSGNNIEAPENLIRRIVREESGKNDNSAVVAAINNLTQVLINKKLIDSPEKFARDYKPYLDAESKRSGTNMVAGFVN